MKPGRPAPPPSPSLPAATCAQVIHPYFECAAIGVAQLESADTIAARGPADQVGRRNVSHGQRPHGALHAPFIEYPFP